MEVDQLDQRQFDRFRAFIYERSGICIQDNKRSLLSNRIRRRLRAGDFDDFDAYYRFLTSAGGMQEIGHFLDAVTTNETSFFRTPAHFEWLRSDFVTEVVADERRGSHPRELRIWSAGCASGAEPYTIAICLLENMYRLRDWTLRVIGTDISEEALRAAREGIFRSRALEEVSEERLRRYFTKVPDQDDCWAVRDVVRELVTFENHNLMTPARHGPFDCIFIRNVLIYFDQESKKPVVSNLQGALTPGGYLVVGPSEGLFHMLDPLERCTTFLYRRPREVPAP